jgi:hypothetical protein
VGITIEVEKHPLKDFTPSKYCEWCVTIKTDEQGGFEAGYQWALDFPPETDILDPKKAKKIKGAPKYSLDPDYGEGTISEVGDKELKICFIAACKDRDDCDMSLERRVNLPAATPLADPSWERVPWEDAPGGVGKIVGPGVASLEPRPQDEVASLASYEALKLAALLDVSPRQLTPTVETRLKGKIHVMALDSWERQKRATRSKQNQRRIRRNR